MVSSGIPPVRDVEAKAVRVGCQAADITQATPETRVRSP
jgi:hypothetical protein